MQFYTSLLILHRKIWLKHMRGRYMSNLNSISSQHSRFFYLLPNSVSRTAFATDSRASHSNGSFLSNSGEYLSLGILGDVVGNFKVAKCA